MTYTYDYPKADLTVDIVVFNPEGTHVLLIRRKNEPFKGRWALPGGYVDIAKGETTQAAAQRELFEETGLSALGIPLGVYDAPHRDPRGRVISVAFWSFLETNQEPRASDDAEAAEWFDFRDITDRNSKILLAFDHYEILMDAAIEYERFK